MARFRLLQISDLHITVPPEDLDLGGQTVWLSTQGWYPSRARRLVLEGVAELVAKLRYSFDALVLSGDLADDGDRRNLETALEFLELPSRQNGDSYTVDGVPTLGYSLRFDQRSVFIVPGNHDRFDQIARIPGGTEFDSVFKSYWEKGVCGVQSMTIRKSGEVLALIGADFCLRSMRKAPIGVWGRGLAEKTTIDALVAETNATREREGQVGIIWILHLPPLLNVERKLKLWNAQAVIDAASACNVNHILAGHLHRMEAVTYNKVEVICVASAASELLIVYGNWIRLLEIDVNSSQVRLRSRNYEYDYNEAAFEER